MTFSVEASSSLSMSVSLPSTSMEMIAPFSVAAAVSASAVLSTNTSGLSITAMAQGLPEATRGRFLGIHFFNPPRQRRLVELIPGADTDPQVVDRMRRFLEEDLGKGVVEARDTPNFIANRLGVFALMQALHGMAAGGLEATLIRIRGVPEM